MELKYIQDKVFEEYKKNGYLRMWNLEGCLKFNTFENRQIKKIYDIAELSLIYTEISELIEGIRKYGEPEYKLNYIGFECADIIIRTLNFMSRKKLNAELYIIDKHKQNMKRGKLHGKFV